MPIPVLCYHKVGPESEEGRRLNIAPEQLRRHVRYFKRRGYRFSLGRDLTNMATQSKTVCFTFDDGYLSTLTHGREALLAEGVRASIYVVSGLIGKASTWDGELARPLADLPILKTALAEGFEIGNHTSGHQWLGRLPAREQAAAISECKTFLEGAGAGLTSVCYPYGSLNEQTVEVARDMGFGVGMALGGRLARLGDEPLALPRVVIAFSDAVPMLIYRLFMRPLLKRRPH
jgi:peptidoglycan/xylan/chitin deacetylase (PgdA/CDA1 family)